MSDFISNSRTVHSGELCKTFQQHDKQRINLTTSLITVRDFPALTIQADRKVRVSIYLPAICWGNTWNGVYLGFNVKINGVQYNMGSSGKAITMAYGTRVSSVHNNTKILDPIAINVVQPGQDYTLQFSIKAKMSTGSARFIYDTNINKAGVWKGVALESARNQNFLNLLVEELVR